MILFSFGNFYLGSDGPDSAPFFDLQIHFGIYRLEWSKTIPRSSEPNPEPSHRCTDGKDPSCVRAAPIEGP
jgi:hypothetical protein